MITAQSALITNTIAPPRAQILCQRLAFVRVRRVEYACVFAESSKRATACLG